VADGKPTRPHTARTKRDARTKLGVTGGARDHGAARVGQGLVGQVVLERYLVEAELGSGAMGTVYRGRHVKLAREVAIKVLHGDLVHDRTMRARFQREAAAAARLRHPNVSGVLDVGASAAGHQLMVMDLVEGETLGALMTGPLERPRILNFVRQILRGLDHAHAAGLVHRDLKPDNVIVEINLHGDEIPRIVDFGIAALRGDDALTGGKLTQTGALIGTPFYMAPEQARGEPVDHRADLFALGVMLFEMMTGMMPFDGSPIEVAIANVNEDLPAIAARAPDAMPDPVLELFLRRLAARDRDRRFATAREALEVLELLERDPADAQVRLGRIDLQRALAVVCLPSYHPGR
jgi:eukaryotic-like serine/threonine-protein kinase